MKLLNASMNIELPMGGVRYNAVQITKDKIEISTIIKEQPITFTARQIKLILTIQELLNDIPESTNT